MLGSCRRGHLAFFAKTPQRGDTGHSRLSFDRVQSASTGSRCTRPHLMCSSLRNVLMMPTMSKVLAFAFLLIASVAQSSELRLSLLEKRTSTTTAYSLEPSTLAFKHIQTAYGVELPQISTYKSVDRKLVGNGGALTDADEILFQCHIDELDLVVVRVEYNSFSSPLKLLSAFSGHPIQVSKIIVLTIANDRLIAENEITRKDSSYHWFAKILN